MFFYANSIDCLTEPGGRARACRADSLAAGAEAAGGMDAKFGRKGIKENARAGIIWSEIAGFIISGIKAATATALETCMASLACSLLLSLDQRSEVAAAGKQHISGDLYSGLTAAKLVSTPRSSNTSECLLLREYSRRTLFRPIINLVGISSAAAEKGRKRRKVFFREGRKGEREYFSVCTRAQGRALVRLCHFSVRFRNSAATPMHI